MMPTINLKIIFQPYPCLRKAKSLLLLIARRIIKIHASRVRQAIQQSAHGDAECGMDRIGSEFAQRNEDKAPPVQFRVRNDQLPLSNDLLTVEEDVQIDDPRPPLHPLGPAHPPFDLLQCLQEKLRVKGPSGSPRRH